MVSKWEEIQLLSTLATKLVVAGQSNESAVKNASKIIRLSIKERDAVEADNRG